MQDQVKIPIGFILEMDDVGWMDGRDYTEIGKASRSGLDRDHCIEDYEILRSITQKTGKHLAAALVVGDWDKDNFLRGQIGFTHDPYGWDRKSEIDVEAHRKCLDVLQAANVDYMLHAVLHGRYDETGKRITEAEHLVIEKSPEGTERRYMIPEEEFRRHLDMFFKIYNSWGLKQKITAYVTPCGIRCSTEENTKKMAKILSEYGIRYWANRFPHFPEGCTLQVYHGVACFHWGGNRRSIPWDEVAVDPKALLEFNPEKQKFPSCLHGSHWTNFLHLDPKDNGKYLDGWVDFYKRQGEVFGSVNSDTLADAVNQHFYYEFARTQWEKNTLTIDLSEVKNQALECHEKEFFLSVKKEIAPKECVGGTLSLWEEHKEFNVYKICHNEWSVSVSFQ